MNNDILAYASLGGVVVALLGMVKFWMDMGATKRDASEALTKADATSESLSDFKATVAKEYASMQALAASEGRLATAIEGMRGDFRTAVSDITGRIDRLLSTVQMGSK